MERDPGVLTQLVDWFWTDPLRGAAAAACVIALALTPIALLVLGRTEYLHTRRGRTYRKPEWWSVVCGTALVMGVPGIVLVLLVKSQYFDEDRYAFDPNETWSVAEQGRRYETAMELSKAAEREYERLQKERAQLIVAVKALDEAMVALRSSVMTPATAEALPGVLEQLAGIRKAVGVDAPQQLIDATAPPIEVARAAPATMPAMAAYPVASMPAGADLGSAPAPAGPGLSPSERQAELADVPDPQRELAALLPLTDLPGGWEVGQSGDRSLETFSADNLFEKIDGRAESFLQYDVVGMAYTYYHPEGDQANEVQLYIFEMQSPLNALGKYGTEKPEEPEPLELGSEGYASGASVFFHAKRYYVQVIPTSDSEEFRDFALSIARRISNEILPGSAPEPDDSASLASTEREGDAEPVPAAEPSGAAESGAEEVDPAALFSLLPEGPGKSGEKYVAQDVFGYAFLSDVFMADYADGEFMWQGFVRPYASPERAREVFDQYRAEAEAFDAEISEVETDSVDAMFVAENFGLVEAVFLKGNAVGGANGATEVEPAKEFTIAFAESMPATAPHLDSGEAPEAETAAGD